METNNYWSSVKFINKNIREQQLPGSEMICGLLWAGFRNYGFKKKKIAIVKIESGLQIFHDSEIIHYKHPSLYYRN